MQKDRQRQFLPVPDAIYIPEQSIDATLLDISASPLNAQAADLWDADQEQFKKHVLSRHRDIEDME